MSAVPYDHFPDTSIILCGEAGQGIQTVEQILVQVLYQCGYHVYATKEYMSRVRGGSNSTELRVGSEPVTAYREGIDVLIPFHREAFSHLGDRLSERTAVLGDPQNLPDPRPDSVRRFFDVPFSRIAAEIGGPIYTNIVAASVILGLFETAKPVIVDFLRRRFSRKGEDVINKNLQAVDSGYTIGRQLRETGEIQVGTKASGSVGPRILVNGAEAVGMGSLLGDCRFLASYPMSPSTGVMVFLARQQGEFDILVEQAEDEISAINMALGASYAGVRSMVTTSGGGFALMTEGISLAGMIETPVVVHLAQRPGPATGLPTRTEQSDLDLVLFAGHGEFPRAVFTPGTPEEAFRLTHRAFNVADEYQIPVFILTDQYLMDTFFDCPAFTLPEGAVERHVVQSSPGYRRYRIVPGGISPRAVPGGPGLVGVDSDEHDEDGHITEDLSLRTRMVEKRLAKLEALHAESLAPELVGPKHYSTLLVGWGSIVPMVREALQRLGRPDLAFLHFKQIYPLHQNTAALLKAARRVIAIEGNATAQLARLIKQTFGIPIESNVLKYSGAPFSVEELIERLGREPRQE